ncbi:hypothetical protein J31TS4_19210 [Paenibacillus sp. J31TS4]|uniref:HK97-gp10 family putative phage morphogenesis protein n=1 Tax=Paenibacillus sp. J31TS4 TaxID=2807195 RepID=UPI001B007BAF|nr:HK97-gp10 family putative phage morphogenesis protein [Paenibacillus sp. J31TS4]GIP38641.1 hypothetical protein J31TS4_19210 [Paenibacillus sp. J31TS4]
MSKPGMSMRTTVNIVGADEIVARLNKIETESRKAVRSQVRKSANAIRKNARDRVAVKSGALQKTITAKYSKDQLAAEIGPRSWRAHFIEFGTVHARAKPFMTPSWEEERPRFMDGIKSAVKGALK